MSLFTDVFVRPPRRSKQVLDHPLFTSTDFGKLIPILVEDLVPGDIFKVQTALEIQLLPTLAPFRHGIEARVDYFFVPNRILWSDWEKFITGGEDGTSAPVKPYVNMVEQQCQVGSLWDYMTLPPQIDEGARGNEETLDPSSEINVDALPFRAYEAIFQEWYRDENLESPGGIENIPKTGGHDYNSYNLHYRGLKKDYFTSALPWTQRGPQVDIPIAGEAPVSVRTVPGMTADTGAYIRASSENPFANVNPRNTKIVPREQGQPTADLYAENINSGMDRMVHTHSIPSLLGEGTADLSEASAITINELRRLNAVQKWFEKNARAGARYVEQILSHFGVRTPDYRLDRPEYLGGNKQILGMAQVLQTSETATSPQGARAGVGYGNMLAKCRKLRADEHGWIIGLLSIIPAQNVYCDGFQRKFTRESKFDYFFPAFQMLGEQDIKYKEIFGYAVTGDEPMDKAFGYTPRYAEYRYHPGEITGEMRTSKAFWHMGRIFNEQPQLNYEFISSYYSLQDYDRLFPTDSELGDRFSVTCQHYERIRRPMMKNPHPSL